MFANSSDVMFNSTVAFGQRLMSWGLMFAFVGFFMLLAADPAIAQTGSGGGLPNIALDKGESSKFIDGIKTWWTLVANGMLFGGLGGAVFGYFFGGGAQWIRWGLVIAVISAFGEPILRWMLKLGGVDVLSSS